MDSAGGNQFIKLRDGHKAVCDDFVARHYEGLYRWFLSLTGDPEKSADLTQDTFVGFWQSLKRTIPQAPPHVWLFSIGRNLWRKHCRTKKRRRAHESDALVEEVSGSDPGPLAVVERAELAAQLTAEVAKLPADYREAITLRLWQDFDYDEIAEVQGISRDLARWRFFRARKLVQAQLKHWQIQTEEAQSK